VGVRVRVRDNVRVGVRVRVRDNVRVGVRVRVSLGRASCPLELRPERRAGA